LLKSLFFIAQETSFVNSYFNDENGLPQNSIKDISKDKEGFIWLATESGLVRFNGKRFRVFKEIDGFTNIREWIDYVNVKIEK